MIKMLQPADIAKAQELLQRLSTVNRRIQEVDTVTSTTGAQISLRIPVGSDQKYSRITGDGYADQVSVALPPNDPVRLQVAEIMKRLIMVERDGIVSQLRDLCIDIRPDYIE